MFLTPFKKDRIYRAIGLMSGTSLDGVDITYCEFEMPDTVWKYKIIVAETFHYDEKMRNELAAAHYLPAFNFMVLNQKYGHFLGKLVSEFIEKHKLQPDFVASHGHTIFHAPHLQTTVQIGSGAAIAAETKLTVISDFRTTDVAFNGQGAPLVPAGDKLLFGEYDACLNMGGFANISYDKNGQRTAYDICPANILLNHIAEKSGKLFDEGGNMAAAGRLCTGLLDSLNNLEYYSKPAPKSLGREWVETNVLPLLHQWNISLNDLLYSCCAHIAFQTARELKDVKNVFVTGGGTHNNFLISLIKEGTKTNIVIPDPLVIDYKEALIFAFLGLLRIHGVANCLNSVTGASCNCSGGAVYLGKAHEIC